MKKETKIEIFFWLVTCLIFIPRFFLETYEGKLKNELIPFNNNQWTIKDSYGAVLYENLELPYDLRWKEQNTKRREWIFEKDLQTENLKNIKDPGIVLGRVGDSDYAFINNCLIGATDYNPNTNQKSGWGWSQLRIYQIPKACISYPNSKITFYIYKSFGPGFGVFSGPMGFGEFTSLKYLGKKLNFFKYTVLAAFGLGLIFFIGVQYFFIFLISERREIYGIFSLMSFFVGVFLLMTSVYPFLFFESYSIAVKFLYASGFLSTVLFLIFLNLKFGVFGKKYLMGYVFLSLPLFVYALFLNNAGQIYTLYEIWHPFFLVAFLICYIQLNKLKPKILKIYYQKYTLAFFIFIVCCFHDVFVSIFALTNSYLIGYAFTFFVLVMGLTLSREYSDAFSYVEEQVVQRTRELNLALMRVTEIQKQKDDQAKRFSHDIRSPLAALKVLKDLIVGGLPEDQGSLLKHAVVRINDLANTALPKLISDQVNQNSDVESIFLWPVIDKIVSEKRLEYKNYQDISVDFVAKGNLFRLSAKCNEVELARCISNLINNSVQAQRPKQHLSIAILLQRDDQYVEMIIQDSGKGIPEDVLSKVVEGFSHEKPTGMGIGLSSTKKLVESWKGELKIHSTLNIGTTVTIRLPISEKPQWLTTSIKLKNIENLVIIDDQPAVLETWKQKLQNSGVVKSLHWIQSYDAWDSSVVKVLNREETIFLVDQDLSSAVTGLDMIQKLKLGPWAILVTANDDDLLLRKKAMDLGVSILPKGLIHAISIEV